MIKQIKILLILFSLIALSSCDSSGGGSSSGEKNQSSASNQSSQNTNTQNNNDSSTTTNDDSGNNDNNSGAPDTGTGTGTNTDTDTDNDNQVIQDQNDQDSKDDDKKDDEQAQAQAQDQDEEKYKNLVNRPSIGVETEMQFFRIPVSIDKSNPSKYDVEGQYYSKTFAASLSSIKESKDGYTKLGSTDKVFEATFDNCNGDKTCAPELISTPLTLERLPEMFLATDCWHTTSHFYEKKDQDQRTLQNFYKTYNSCLAKTMEKDAVNLNYWQVKKEIIPSCKRECNRFTVLKSRTNPTILHANNISIQLNIGIPVKNFREGKEFLKLLTKKKIDDSTGYHTKHLYLTWSIGQKTARHFMETNADKIPDSLTKNEKETLEGLLAYFIAHVGVFYHSKNSWVLLPKVAPSNIYKVFLESRYFDKKKISQLIEDSLFKSYDAVLNSFSDKEKDEDIFKYQRTLSTEDKNILAYDFTHNTYNRGQENRGLIYREPLKASSEMNGKLDYLTIIAIQKYLLSQSYPNQKTRFLINGRWISTRNKKAFKTGDEFAKFLSYYVNPNKPIKDDQDFLQQIKSGGSSAPFDFGSEDSLSAAAKDHLSKFLTKKGINIPDSEKDDQKYLINKLKGFLRNDQNAWVRIWQGWTGKSLPVQVYDSLSPEEKILGTVVEVRSGYLTDYAFGVRPRAFYGSTDDWGKQIDPETGIPKYSFTKEQRMSDRNKSNYKMLKRIMAID